MSLQTDKGTINIRLQNGEIDAVVTTTGGPSTDTMNLAVPENMWSYVGVSWRQKDGRVSIMVKRGEDDAAMESTYRHFVQQMLTVSQILYFCLN